MLTNWLRHRNNHGAHLSRLPRKRSRNKRPLSLEVLEGRLAPATFLVTNLNDAGAGSLRRAALAANVRPGEDVIKFQDGLTGTITLTSGQIALSGRSTAPAPPSSL
jgi:hypothetical protein